MFFHAQNKNQWHSKGKQGGNTVSVPQKSWEVHLQASECRNANCTNNHTVSGLQFNYIGNLTHDSGVNFDFDADVLVGLAQQQHLLAQDSLLLRHVLARHLQASWETWRERKTKKRPDWISSSLPSCQTCTHTPYFYVLAWGNVFNMDQTDDKTREQSVNMVEKHFITAEGRLNANTLNASTLITAAANIRQIKSFKRKHEQCDRKLQ